MATLERAIALAAERLAGKYDKAGEAIILHSLRVMFRMSTTKEQIVAVLHEIKEDGGMTDDDLRREGFDEDVIRGVDAVSRREGESYNSFIDRAAEDMLGGAAKAGDLEENMRLERIASPTDEDFARTVKYRKASARLERKRREAGTL